VSNPIQDALNNPLPAPQMAQAGDVAPELERMEEYDRFPPGCPIKVLGNQQDVSGKQTCYYLNFNGQLVGLEAGNKHGKLALAAMFGPKVGWLEANFPKWSAPKNEYDRDQKKWIQVEPPRIVGVDQAKAAEALVIECTRKGIFDPAGRLRGRGAHKLSTGKGMVLHCGDALLVSSQKVDGSIKGWRYEDPGLHERYVYQAGEAVPRPWHEPVGDKPAEQLLAVIQTWNWKRALLDPRFVLGAIALGPVGGAAAWRSHLWITGGKGTGKSTLNGKDGLVHRCFGEGVFRTANTSAAGLRQTLKNSTVPVMLDEVEASKNNDRVLEVVELARISSSGDDMTRGSSDHSAQNFTLQSCFWMSSINIPPLPDQDRSRLAILELLPLPDNLTPIDLDAIDFASIGRQLMRRMIDGWERFAATKLKFHAAFAAAGHTARACDQFCTLLAAADVVLNDHTTADGLPDDEEVAHWTTLCRPQRMVEVSETTPDHQACVNHITTSIVQARGGDEREQIATWIGRVVTGALEPLLAENAGHGEKASERLQQIGLKLVNARYYPEKHEGGKVAPARWGTAKFEKDEPGYLAVAGEHQGLAKIFDGTTWQGGVWKQALGRNPGALEGVKVKFGKMSLRAVLVPLAAVLDEDELPHASLPAEVAKWVAAQISGEPV
jgi:hypothetical protein